MDYNHILMVLLAVQVEMESKPQQVMQIIPLNKELVVEGPEIGRLVLVEVEPEGLVIQLHQQQVIIQKMVLLVLREKQVK
jgi:hypothetical protein